MEYHPYVLASIFRNKPRCVFRVFLFSFVIWVFPKIKVPQNGWWNNGKPYLNGWFGGTTIFGNTHLENSEPENFRKQCTPISLRSLRPCSMDVIVGKRRRLRPHVSALEQPGLVTSSKNIQNRQNLWKDAVYQNMLFWNTDLVSRTTSQYFTLKRVVILTLLMHQSDPKCGVLKFFNGCRFLHILTWLLWFVWDIHCQPTKNWSPSNMFFLWVAFSPFFFAFKSINRHFCLFLECVSHDDMTNCFRIHKSALWSSSVLLYIGPGSREIFVASGFMEVPASNRDVFGGPRKNAEGGSLDDFFVMGRWCVYF